MKEKTIFISAVRDFKMYDAVIKTNPFVQKDNIVLEVIDNTAENRGLSKRYNDFLERYDYLEKAWFVFCHEDWEILEGIAKKLEDLDRNCLYGSFGARTVKTKDGQLKREYVGNIYDCAKDHTNLRKIGKEFKGLEKVDVLDCQVLIVHSDLINKHTLRFDEQFEWDLYVEDFCLNAFVKHAIVSRVLDLEVCHCSQVTDISQRPSCLEKYPYINEKYKQYSFAGIVRNIGGKSGNIQEGDLDVRMAGNGERSTIYQNRTFLENDPRYININYIKPDKRVLDVGCACGDFAFVLKKKKVVEVWGMEYDQGSIDIARKTRMFEEVFRVDLNDFDPKEYEQFYSYFNYIVFGDVLEHILDPKGILEKFKVFLREDGEFLLSIPNVAHASIKANLLLDDFSYTPCGLLDETHLRFFTYKTIPTLLAEIGLQIKENKVTYYNKIGFQSTNPYNTLPGSVKELIFKDFHSYVLQYVLGVGKSALPEKELLKINAEKMFIDERLAPRGLLEMRERDLSELEVSTEDDVSRLNMVLEKKDREIDGIKNSKFWKLRNMYLKILGVKNDSYE